MAKSVFFFGDGMPEGDPERRDLLGGKGAGLAEMTAMELPVPPGFTISTEVCVAYTKTHAVAGDVRAEVDAALARLEKKLGARLGDPASPLLVSVRSGARASMPGMMDTILNLGLNDAVAEALATRTGNPRFAYDAYRRFVAMHSNVALGVSKDPFDHALDTVRARVATTKGIERS
jgi:pyruvate,orthophosphate dikinase